jgi:methionyl-tRNA formyltransferase
MKVAVSGNTKLTYKGLQLLLSLGYEVAFLFGLPDEQLSSKVNSIDLTDFSEKHNIPLYKTNNWEDVLGYEAEIVISLGDSRYVPPFVLDKFKVIGNHGAVLPFVQGGASLVWGRMLDGNEWGVSLMELDKKIDNGKILKTRTFRYDADIDMNSFCEKSDDALIELLEDLLLHGADETQHKSSKIDVKVSKHIDSKVCVELLQFCLDNDLNVYLPPRTAEDGKIKNEWGDEFIDRFKKANDEPYPKYFYTANGQ